MVCAADKLQVIIIKTIKTMAKVTTINTKTDEVTVKTFSTFKKAKNYYEGVKNNGNIHALQH